MSFRALNKSLFLVDASITTAVSLVREAKKVQEKTDQDVTESIRPNALESSEEAQAAPGNPSPAELLERLVRLVSPADWDDYQEVEQLWGEVEQLQENQQLLSIS